MAIVELEISYKFIDEDGIRETYDTKTFYLDTFKIERIMVNEPEKLYYSSNELSEVLDYIKRFSKKDMTISDGTDKYSLYDTEWEYELVKAEQYDKIDYYFYREVW